DPMATHAEQHVSRATWLGLRVGGGMFDDGAAAARAGLALAATGRMQLSCDLFAAARLDWSRRGGGDGIDVVGASAGVGSTVVDNRTIAIALIAQLRGDVRLASLRGMTPVDRMGASVAGGI